MQRAAVIVICGLFGLTALFIACGGGGSGSGAEINSYLYVLDNDNLQIVAYAIDDADGSLTAVPGSAPADSEAKALIKFLQVSLDSTVSCAKGRS